MTGRESLLELPPIAQEMAEFLSHQSWRCDYRTRYGECQCGLDDLCDRLGVDRVPPEDPEATPCLRGGERP